MLLVIAIAKTSAKTGSTKDGVMRRWGSDLNNFVQRNFFSSKDICP
jgi:hypothetical protein